MKFKHMVLRSSRLATRDIFSGPVIEAAAAAEMNLEVEELDRRDIALISRDMDVLALAPTMPMRLVEPIADRLATPEEAQDIGWGVKAVGADTSACTGDGIVVAVLDTGIDASHPAFQSVDLLQRNFTAEDAGDLHGHGTHCAGSIFGRPVGGTRIGVAQGVNKALIGKVLGKGGGSSEQIVNAYDPDGGTASQVNRNLISGLQRNLHQRVSQWSEGCKKDQTDLQKRATGAKRLAPLTKVVEADGKKDKTDPQKCTTVAELLAPLTKVVEADAKASETAKADVVIVRAEPLQVPKDAGAPSGSGTRRPAADCSLGICHRSLQPYVVTLEIRDVFAQSTVVTLPNGGDPVVLPLDRAAFVKTEHTVTMQNGQITSVHTVRPSSALALVSWPLDVYKAVLTSTAELIQLRIGANTNEVKLAQSQLDTAQALKRIAEGMEALNTPKPELSPSGGHFTGPSRGNAMLAVALGQRKWVESESTLPKQIGGQKGPVPGLGIVPQVGDGKPGKAGKPGPDVPPIANQ